MFTLNLVSLFTLFASWAGIPTDTKLNVLEKLATSHPDLVMAAFKDLYDPSQSNWKRDIYAFLRNAQAVSAIKALREERQYDLWGAKQIIDYVRFGEDIGSDSRITYEMRQLAYEMRSEYLAY